MDDISQFAIDLMCFMFTQAGFFKFYAPMMSQDFQPLDRKAQMVRMVIRPGGPLNINGTRYENMDDRRDEQDAIIVAFYDRLQAFLDTAIEERYPEL